MRKVNANGQVIYISREGSLPPKFFKWLIGLLVIVLLATLLLIILFREKFLSVSGYLIFFIFLLLMILFGAQSNLVLSSKGLAGKCFSVPIRRKEIAWDSIDSLRVLEESTPQAQNNPKKVPDKVLLIQTKNQETFIMKSYLPDRDTFIKDIHTYNPEIRVYGED